MIGAMVVLYVVGEFVVVTVGAEAKKGPGLAPLKC